MQKIIGTSKWVVITIVGVAVGAFGYWTISPLFFNVRVDEASPQVTTGVVVQRSDATPVVDSKSLSGNFQGLAGHAASGVAEIIEADGRRYVRLKEDFSVTNGPDLFVYLGKNGAYDPEVNLGRLKGNQGAQNYEIATTINLADYDSVWVWCKAFSTPFGMATLQ